VVSASLGDACACPRFSAAPLACTPVSDTETPLVRIKESSGFTEIPGFASQITTAQNLYPASSIRYAEAAGGELHFQGVFSEAVLSARGLEYAVHPTPHALNPKPEP